MQDRERLFVFFLFHNSYITVLTLLNILPSIPTSRYLTHFNNRKSISFIRKSIQLCQLCNQIVKFERCNNFLKFYRFNRVCLISLPINDSFFIFTRDYNLTLFSAENYLSFQYTRTCIINEICGKFIRRGQVRRIISKRNCIYFHALYDGVKNRKRSDGKELGTSRSTDDVERRIKFVLNNWHSRAKLNCITIVTLYEYRIYLWAPAPCVIQHSSTSQVKCV